MLDRGLPAVRRRVAAGARRARRAAGAGRLRRGRRRRDRPVADPAQGAGAGRGRHRGADPRDLPRPPAGRRGPGRQRRPQPARPAGRPARAGLVPRGVPTTRCSPAPPCPAAGSSGTTTSSPRCPTPRWCWPRPRTAISRWCGSRRPSGACSATPRRSTVLASWADGDRDDHSRRASTRPRCSREIEAAADELEESWRPVLTRFAGLHGPMTGELPTAGPAAARRLPARASTRSPGWPRSATPGWRCCAILARAADPDLALGGLVTLAERLDDGPGMLAELADDEGTAMRLLVGAGRQHRPGRPPASGTPSSGAS